jgi:hypothetical protein
VSLFQVTGVISHKWRSFYIVERKGLFPSIGGAFINAGNHTLEKARLSVYRADERSSRYPQIALINNQERKQW